MQDLFKYFICLIIGRYLFYILYIYSTWSMQDAYILLTLYFISVDLDFWRENPPHFLQTPELISG